MNICMLVMHIWFIGLSKFVELYMVVCLVKSVSM